MSSVREGTVVDGRYRVERRIGSGGMADVWLADDLDLPRKVALKILHAHYARDPQFIERFRREAEAAAGLQHTNIVPIFDRGQMDEDTYYIAMAWLEGSTLRDLINIGMTPEESVSIVRQILEAAGFAHSRGVIHRDLKPLNVIVDATGKATVTDFGIARAGVSDMTETGSVMGTANYLSPEQAQGMDVGPQSDLYSVGVILYECLAGRTPFEGETAVAVALRQATEEPPPPSAYNPSVSPALDAVVMASLARQPYERFPDAYSFIAALDAAMADPNAYAIPVEEKKNNAWKWILGILVGILVVLAIVGLARSNTTDVPDVTGNDLNTAISLLRQDGYTVSGVEHVSRNAPRDRVVKQDPTGESDKDCSLLGWFCKNPEVKLTVSDGPGKVEIPDVAGESSQDGQTELEQAGFTVTVASQPSSDVDEGLVIKTDPAAGDHAKKGAEVTMYVSSGAKQVAVPPVVGQTLGGAGQTIESKGLEFTSTTEQSDRPSGEVITQTPTAGTKVDPGSTVELVVSEGQPDSNVTVPSLVGLTESAAESKLRGLGLVPTAQNETTTNQNQDGKVLSQSPDSGTSLAAGAQVVITVGSFTPPDTGPTADDTNPGGGITP